MQDNRQHSFCSGEHLARILGCSLCHTMHDEDGLLPSAKSNRVEFSGSIEIRASRQCPTLGAVR